MDLKTYLWRVRGTELRYLLDNFIGQVKDHQWSKDDDPDGWSADDEQELNLLIECQDLTAIAYNCYLGLQKPEDFDNYGT